MRFLKWLAKKSGLIKVSGQISPGAERQSKLASLGMIAAGVGHEINNPLAVIMSDLFLLRQYAQQESFDMSQFEMALERMEISAQQIKMISAELNFLAILHESENKEFLLAEEVSKTLKLVQRYYQAEGVQLDFKSNEPVSTFRLFGPSRYISQIIMNLLANAKEATAGSNTPIVEIELKIRADEATLSVQDNGKGILPELQAKIFDDFYSTKNAKSGLGLSLVNKMMRQLGGTIEVSSQVGRGTQILLKFKSAKKLKTTFGPHDVEPNKYSYSLSSNS